ncbi:response regulator transcription factor [Geomicrobium sp. JCM 19038]|uniref:response regulator transcription factor n=1 Tax=Geomicrobium sp. JCM 19038 TaxID=1460635 RepID=UPI00045F3E30|nr:response regulator transcription factor [Geomicrobium sp. JCM 19038]GAK08103.1 putative two-component system response regulator [Geomicrobium sp. JCM 19038]
MIRIILAEDQGMLLGALASLLELEDDMTVVGKATNGLEAVELVREHQPDICIMDIEMPLMTGIEAAESLKDETCKIIVLTTFARTGYFNYAREAGVSGYLLKDSPSDELARAIRTIMSGRKVYAPELMDMMHTNINPLTEREGQVISLIAEGKSTKEVADLLDIKTGTVRNYVSVIYEKLNVSNRIEAISLFKEKGWFK